MVLVYHWKGWEYSTPQTSSDQGLCSLGTLSSSIWSSRSYHWKIFHWTRSSWFPSTFSCVRDTETIHEEKPLLLTCYEKVKARFINRESDDLCCSPCKRYRIYRLSSKGPHHQQRVICQLTKGYQVQTMKTGDDHINTPYHIHPPSLHTKRNVYDIIMYRLRYVTILCARLLVSDVEVGWSVEGNIKYIL